MESARTSSIAALIQEITEGRPYVFVLMPFGSQWHLFKDLKDCVWDTLRLACIRADDIPGAGFDLLEKVHIAIERSEFIFAELSDCNPNVFYELGYAAGIKKPILLLARAGTEIPSDMRGRELILHSDQKGADETLIQEIKNHLTRRMNSQIAPLRDMLEAERPQPAFIIASPKYPSHSILGIDQPRDSRTFGDNLGIRGLLSAFGSIFGEAAGVELLSGQYCTEGLPDRDLNLYLIGSPKVNLVTQQVMRMIQSGNPVWRFGPPAGVDERGNYPVVLYRLGKNGEEAVQGSRAKRGEIEIHIEDYGVVMRGPHPNRPGRLLMVMAGAHSLGTGAACLAATQPTLIKRIREKGLDIANREQSFWVLVKAVESSHDHLLDVDGVDIREVGIF